MSRNYLTINGLMKHLRLSGININGSYQKRQLVNYGYYHGYKGYRFFVSPSRKIPYSDYKQVVAVINYDNSIKALLYPHLMFIETALKNITLNIVLEEANSHDLNDIFDKLMPGYIGAPPATSEDQKKKMQKRKLSLQNRIRSSLLRAYEKDHKIVMHFYNNRRYNDVPIWGIFEILTLGDFGTFVSCLNQSTRLKVSKYIDLDLSGDTNTTLVYQMIFVIKDLRNAVAHNDIIFDTRFRNTDASRPLKTCITHDVGISYINLKSIIDYIVLIAYILKKLKKPKREILSMINSFERSVTELQKEVPTTIYSMVVHADTGKKINDLKAFIKQ